MALHPSPNWRTTGQTRASAQKLVKINTLRVARGPYEFVTQGVGAGLVVCLQDPRAGIAAMLHFMLPSSQGHSRRAAQDPHVFGDTGLRAVVATLESMGARRERVRAKLVGGAAAPGLPAALQIGPKNVDAALSILSRLRVSIVGKEVGGSLSRSVLFIPTNELVQITLMGRPGIHI